MVDSSTGGILSPAASPAPLDGLNLNNFFQTLFVALTGLDSTLVRPAYQPEPGNIPDAGVAWMAFRYTTRPIDPNPYLGYDQAGNYEFQRHEYLDLMLSFYDLGTNGLADYYCSLIRDGLKVPQSNEYLQNAGMGLIKTGDKAVMPSLVQSRWQYGVDLPIVVSRAVQRYYPVLTVLQATGSIVTDVGLIENLTSIP